MKKLTLVTSLSDFRPQTFAGLGLFDAIVIIHRPKLGCPILAPPRMELARTSGEKLCDRFSLDLSKDTIIHQSGLHTKQQHMPKDQYFTQSIPMQWMQDDAGCMLQIHSSLAAGRHQHSVLRKVHAWELWPSVTTRSDSDAFSKRHQRY